MGLAGFVKRRLNQLLMPYGHVVARASTVPSWERFFDFIMRNGLTPNTVFDIGVATGTPVLYAHFPDARYVLVDPTAESLPHMESWSRKLNAQILNLALGDQDGDATIDVRDEIGGSSLFDEVGPYTSVKKYSVPVRRFDRVVDGFEPPALCKIDVQGAELMLLRGMGDRIREFDFFVIEVSTIPTLHDGPDAFAVIEHMRRHGFVMFDILNINRRPLDGALAQLDLAFVAEDSPLRRDRRWRPSN